MIDFAQIHESFTLEGYTGVAHLAGAVRELQSESSILVPQLVNRTIWMVNSTAEGGGVAEMLPKMVKLLRELGLRIQWVTIGTDRAEFFALTKRLHNMIHGEGEPSLGGGDQELFDSVNRQAADALKPHLSPEDIVVIHDPQPIAMGPYLKRELGVRTVWRCHIGLDEQVPATRAVWRFLKPYALTYDRAVFTAPEYIPDYLAGYSTIMHPALDPESHKNRELSPHKLVGILCNAGLARPRHATAGLLYGEPSTRLSSVTANDPEPDRTSDTKPARPIVHALDAGNGPLNLSVTGSSVGFAAVWSSSTSRP